MTHLRFIFLGSALVALLGIAGGSLQDGAPSSKPVSLAPAMANGGVFADLLQRSEETKSRFQESAFRLSILPQSPERYPRLLSAVEVDVRDWISHFTTEERASFEALLRRGSRFRTMIESTLAASGIPAQFYYLPLIESGFSAHAASTQGAVGMWQLVKSTGRRYGLVIKRRIDQRRDPRKSTQAAARYLADLHRKFQSWELVLAAYNAGEGRLQSALEVTGSRTFSSLVKSEHLPRETREFVPKFLAAVMVGENPGHFGL
jgi:soluble lytic murein transglycosylase-like protein